MPASRARPGELLTERAGFSVFQGLELEAAQISASELALRALEPVGFSSDSAPLFCQSFCVLESMGDPKAPAGTQSASFATQAEQNPCTHLCRWSGRRGLTAPKATRCWGSDRGWSR